jgi:hypothetical protein
MVFEYPAPCCSVVWGKGGVFTAWFSEPPNKEFGSHEEREMVTHSVNTVPKQFF